MKRNPLLPEKIDFQHFAFPETSNYFLFSPPGYCNVPSEPSSIPFACPVEKLQALFQEAIQPVPRLKLRSFSEQTHRFHYVHTSRVFNFIDYIVVQFIPVSEQESTILIYSYSVLGKFDFGVNKSRVFNWMLRLKKVMQRDGVI